MARPRMRPTFVVDLACPGDQVMDALRHQLVLDAEDVEGEFSTRHGVLRIPQARSRFWTPCLDLTVEDCEAETSDGAPGHSKLWGTFTPRPEIWTGFVFAIGTLVILSIFSIVYGIAQIVLGHAPLALLVPVIAFVGAAFLYASALVGQGLSISEMYRLRAFVDDCLRAAKTSAPARPLTPRESAQL
jgi:hypothetical protein